MNRIIGRALFYALVMSAAGCRLKEGGRILLEPKATPDVEQVDFSVADIDFETLKKTSFKSCQKCHSLTEKPLLVTLDDWRNEEGSVIDMLESGDMPPQDKGYGPLSPCELDMAKRWYQLGAPERSDIKVITISSCEKLKTNL